MIAVAQINIIGVGLRHIVVQPPQAIKTLGAGHVQWPDDECIHDAEHHRVRPNCQRQRQNCRQRESRRFAQHSQGDAYILDRSLNQVSAKRLVAFVFDLLLAAKLYAGTALCFLPVQSGTFQIFRA